MPRQPTTNKDHGANRNRLRIIGGTWRSRMLPFAGPDGLRPTPDRVRETLFNWLQNDIAGARCLDLFCGSGALSFEALSRGAASAVMIESDSHAISALKENAARLQCRSADIQRGDALQWLRTASGRGQPRFDLIFLDPPFAAQLLQPAIDLLVAADILSDHAVIYVESAASAPAPAVPDDWQPDREKTAGQVCSRLYRRAALDPDAEPEI